MSTGVGAISPVETSIGITDYRKAYLPSKARRTRLTPDIGHPVDAGDPC
jgi:hypothetical protein